MNKTPVIPRWWLIYSAIVAAIAATALVLSLGAQRADGRLLACFDDYATASAKTSQAVRDASVVVSTATRDRDDALQDVYLFIGQSLLGVKVDEAEGERLFRALLESNAVLVDAHAALAQVRADNPVPDPPSQFCND